MIVRLLVFAATLYSTNAVLPAFLKVCKKSDPNIAACIINSVNEIRPQLVGGIPELNVPPLEPLPLETIKLRSGASSAKIDANITNLKVWGPSSFQILELKPNLAKNRFVFRVNVPHIHFEGDYDIDMNVLILKYKGQGPITGNFTDLLMDVLMKGRVTKIGGTNHLVFEKFDLRLHIGKSRIHLGNLFAQNPNLGQATNEVVNQNTDIFIDEIKPALEESLAVRFTEVANIITKTFTYEELFPAD